MTIAPPALRRQWRRTGFSSPGGWAGVFTPVDALTFFGGVLHVRVSAFGAVGLQDRLVAFVSRGRGPPGWFWFPEGFRVFANLMETSDDLLRRESM